MKSLFFAQLMVSAAAALAAILLLPFPAVSSVLFERTFVNSDQYRELLVSSTRNNGGIGLGYQFATSFKLPSDGSISYVNWWGTTCDANDEFQLTVYSSVDNSPGQVLASTLVQPQAIETPYKYRDEDIMYFSANLASQFVAGANTEYFFSIFNSAADTRWLWLASDAVIPTLKEGRQRLLSSSTWEQQSAATLILSSVPEPSAAALLTVASFGILAIRRR